jgi:hypothetical protein
MPYVLLYSKGKYVINVLWAICNETCKWRRYSYYWYWFFFYFEGYSCRYYYNRNIKISQHQESNPTSCSTSEVDELVHPLREKLTEDSSVQTEILWPPKWFVKIISKHCTHIALNWASLMIVCLWNKCNYVKEFSRPQYWSVLVIPNSSDSIYIFTTQLNFIISTLISQIPWVYKSDLVVPTTRHMCTKVFYPCFFCLVPYSSR